MRREAASNAAAAGLSVLEYKGPGAREAAEEFSALVAFLLILEIQNDIHRISNGYRKESEAQRHRSR